MAGSNRKTQLGGAAVLALANTVCRILGFMFKVPLSNLVGSEGMGYFSLATQVFGVATFAACTGLPVVFGRTVAAYHAKKQPTLPCLKAVCPVFLLLGLAFALLMGALAGLICRIAGAPTAVPSVLALSPAVFFVASESMYRAYFQGKSRLAPGALAQTCEGAAKLFVGTAAAYFLYSRGASPAFVAAGAAIGVTFGTAVSAGVLRIGLFKEGKMSSVQKEKGIAKTVLKESLPISLGAGVMSIIGAADAAVILQRLRLLGNSAGEAASLYGIYTGYAVTVYALPFALTGAINAWSSSAIAGAYALENGKRLEKNFRRAVRVSGCIGFFAGACYMLMPGELLKIFFSRSEAELAAPLLALLSASVVLSPLTGLQATALQAMGKTKILLVSGLVCGGVKLGLNYLLVGLPELGIAGAPISAAVSSLIAFAICGGGLSHHMGRLGARPGFLRELSMPAFCGVLSGCAARELCPLFSRFAGERLGAIIAVLVGGAVFVSLGMLTGILNADELLIFKREKNGEEHG